MRTPALPALLLPTLVFSKHFKEDVYLRDVETTAAIASASPASVPTAGSPAATQTADLNSIELRHAPGMDQIGGAPVVNPAPADPVTETLVVLVTAEPVAPIDPALAVPVNPAPAPPADPAAAPVPAEPVAPVDPAPAVPVDPILPAVPMPAPPANAAAPIDAAHTAVGLVPVAPTETPISGAFVTVQWVETTLGGTYSTWMPHTIAFWFQPEHTQPALPGKGEIGMGTLTGRTGQTRTIVSGAGPTQGPGWAKGVAAAVGVGIAGMIV